MVGTRAGMPESRRSSRPFDRYASAVPAPGSFAMMQTDENWSASASTNCRATASSSIEDARNSNDRRTRETSETTTIAMMNTAAIRTPSGRSMTFATVV